MLPRVSAMIAQLIAPITMSAASQQQASHGQKPFERFVADSKRHNSGKGNEQENKKEDSPQKPLAPVVPIRSQLPEVTPEPAPLPAGVSLALFQMMAVLKEQRASILRWIGVSMYQAAPRLQKKNGRVRKGTIIDRRAE